MVFGIGPEGDRLDTPTPEFRALVEKNKSLIFRVWTDRNDDMLCEFRNAVSPKVEWYSFGQLETDDADFIAALTQRFRSAAGAGDSVLVVDWYGRTENFDWEAFLAGDVGYVGVPPEVLGFPVRFASSNRFDTHDFDAEEFEGHVLYFRKRKPAAPLPEPEESREP